MEKLLTAQELAELLNLSVETIWRYTRLKKIPVVELGQRQYRYEKDAVLTALAMGNSAVKEERAGYCTNQNGYTYNDYLKLPEEPGYRHEILEGILVKEPAPSTHHQRILRVLGYQLMTYFNEFDPVGELFFAPLDVTLTVTTVVQPDILFVSGTRKGNVRPERIDGACDLAVEILSPSTRQKDRVQKLEIYRKAGIPHYWLVDPEDNILEALALKDGNYVLKFSGGPGDTFNHSDFPGLKLDLNQVFYRP